MARREDTPGHPDEATRPWLEMRQARTSPDDMAYHGSAGPRPPRTWSVSARRDLHRCPFKFFAQHVLRLEEEPDDEEVMDPRRQGQFVHEVFETFFNEWQERRAPRDHADNLPLARELFAAVVDRALAARAGRRGGARTHAPSRVAGGRRTWRSRVPDGGGAARAGGRTAARAPARRPGNAPDRDGSSHDSTAGKGRSARSAERRDFPPDRLQAGLAAGPGPRAAAANLRAVRRAAAGCVGSQVDAGRSGVSGLQGAEAGRAPVHEPTRPGRDARAAQQRLADTLDAIERGEFPPTPDDVFRCETCSFAAVCRKDYVGDI